MRLPKSTTNEEHINENGHGTAIYGIIRKCIDIAEIINIPFNYDIDNGGETHLIQILTEITKLSDINIINLSLGCNICNKFDELYNICKNLTDKGVIIVSAFDNAGAISYPAAFENIIGVVSSRFCNNVDEFDYIDDNVVNIGAKGNPQRILWSSPQYMILGGSSFACAHVTVQIAKWMIEGIRTYKDILNKFQSIAVRKYASRQIKNKNREIPFTIKRAALFPFNKEMHSLIRFIDDLSFNIIDIYDSKYTLRVGATTDHLLKDNKNIVSYIIKDIEKIIWDNIDTLILGHTDELLNVTNNTNIRDELIKNAVKNNVNIFSFDPILLSELKNSYFPSVTTDVLQPHRFGMLYHIAKPVLGIFGTSSQQGKFTVQLILRKLLIKEGYSIGQIGTEPTSLLYGMDEVFPMGYNSTVYIKEFDVIRYLNYIINEMCGKNNDLIIVGSQSGTVPYDIGNLERYNIPNYLFLMGTNPDAVILCINPFDDIGYIERTIKFIESSVECDVIALVIFPMDIKDDWAGIYGTKQPLSNEKYIIIKEQLYNRFNIPVFKLGDDNNMANLAEKVINYFANE